MRHTDRPAEPDQLHTIFVVLPANLPGSIHTGLKDSSGEQSHADMGANREGDFSRWFLYNHRPRRHKLTVGNLTRHILEFHTAHTNLIEWTGKTIKTMPCGCSQPCSLFLSMLHLSVAKARRLLPPAGLMLKDFLFSRRIS